MKTIRFWAGFYHFCSVCHVMTITHCNRKNKQNYFTSFSDCRMKSPFFAQSNEINFSEWIIQTIATEWIVINCVCEWKKQRSIDGRKKKNWIIALFFIGFCCLWICNPWVVVLQFDEILFCGQHKAVFCAYESIEKKNHSNALRAC